MDIIKYYNDKNINYIRNSIKNYINELEKTNSYKFLYIYGENGIGKTTIIKDIITSMNYSINYIDCNHNKLTLEELLNISNNKDVYSMFFNNIKSKAIIMDNINYYLHNDKTYFNNLIKLLKKNIKQKNYKFVPFIFINTIQEEKKFIELSKISYNLKILPPSNLHLQEIIKQLYPNIFKIKNYKLIITNILNYLNNKYYKIDNLKYFYDNNLITTKFDNSNNFNNTINDNNIKLLTKNFLEFKYSLNNLDIINYSDRTSLSLLIHENIINLFDNDLKLSNLKIYKKILENFIFTDCIDKNIFLHQIWQLNDIIYIIKIYYNNFILSKNNLLKTIPLNDIIFTKILTKYSSEYNNYNFILINTQTYSINKKNLLLDIYTINNNNEYYSKLIYNRFIKLLNFYSNYKITNCSKFIDDDINCYEFFH